MVFSAVLVCSLAMALLIYRYDMYEREPWYMLVLAGVLGMASSWAIGYVEDFILILLPEQGRSLAVLAAVAGTLEELVKLLAVLAIWTCISSHFNDPFDGLIYGGMVGLGFALTETLFYMELAGSKVPWYSVVGQEFVRTVLHILMGALTCVGLGLARFRVAGWPQILVGCVTASMAIHFCWDYFCGLPRDDELSLFQRAIAVGLMVTAFTLFGVSVVVALRRSEDTHAVNKLGSLWGWPFSLLTSRKDPER